MTVRETADILHFEILTGGGALDRPIQSVYSCDLLSFVMGRAPADSAWATVMGNVNAMAVAVLADVACVVLAEGAATMSAPRPNRTISPYCAAAIRYLKRVLRSILCSIADGGPPAAEKGGKRPCVLCFMICIFTRVCRPAAIRI